MCAIASAVHGYHVYTDIWEAEMSSEFSYFPPKPDNRKHCYTVAILQASLK